MDETKRIEIMREGLKLKLDHCKEFKEYLFSTGIKEYCKAFKDYVYNDYKDLVEYATWGDSFWGVVSVGRGTQEYRGRNILGKLLMELRGEYCLTESGMITPISTPVEPPTVEVAPTIQPTEKKPLKQPKQDEEQKHIYVDSLLDRLKGDFIVRYRIEDRVEEYRVDSYGEACDLYQQAQDIMTTSNNPCWLALFNGDDIIEIELYN